MTVSGACELSKFQPSKKSPSVRVRYQTVLKTGKTPENYAFLNVSDSVRFVSRMFCSNLPNCSILPNSERVPVVVCNSPGRDAVIARLLNMAKTARKSQYRGQPGFLSGFFTSGIIRAIGIFRSANPRPTAREDSGLVINGMVALPLTILLPERFWRVEKPRITGPRNHYVQIERGEFWPRLDNGQVPVAGWSRG